MKIGVITHNYPRFRGDFSGRFVESLSEALVALGHRVMVVAPWDPAYARLPSDHRVEFELYRYAPLARWHRLGYARSMQSDLRLRGMTYLLAPLLFSRGSRAVWQWAERERPDILHAHWLLPNGYVAARAARHFGIPLVVSIPGSDATVAGQNPLFRAMARQTLRQAGLVTANATALRDLAVAQLGADPRKFDLIPYGVDPCALTPSRTGTAELRAQLGIPMDAVVLLAVGRMVPKKGFDVLLRAVARLKEDREWARWHGGLGAARGQALVFGLRWPAQLRHGSSRASGGPELHVVLVGEGDLWRSWQALGAQLGLGERAHWVGQVPADRIAAYYNLADVFVMPAVTRPVTGLAVAVLDAMSCGVPVIASRADGNELAVVHGVTGLLVSEGDDGDLATAIASLADDPARRRQMGLAGRRRVETDLGWPQLAHRYVAHFERLSQDAVNRAINLG